MDESGRGRRCRGRTAEPARVMSLHRCARHPIGVESGIQGVHVGIHDQREPHVMRRLADLARAGGRRWIAMLEVQALRLRIEEPVVATIDLRVEGSTVRQMALGGGGGRHKTDANTQKQARGQTPAGWFAKPPM